MIRNIVFDFGGVLVDWDPRIPYLEAFHGNKEKANWFIETVCNHDWNLQLDKGLSFDEGIAQLQKIYPDYHDEIALYKTKWPEMLIGPKLEVVNILRALCATDNYHMFAITNWSAETFPIAERQYEFFRWFEDIVVSGKISMIKPNEDIFQYSLNRFQIKAEESVFIDDNILNIKTARDLGFRAIHFIDSSNLISELEQLNVHY